MKRVDSKEELDGINDAPMKKLRDNIVQACSRVEYVSKQLSAAVTTRDEAINEMLEAMTTKARELEADRKAFELSTQRVGDTLVPRRIKLDVGGHIFSATPEMMQRFPNSYFASLFSGRWDDKQTEDGAYFINRSGRLFDHILDFLRDGELSTALSEEDRDALYKEADYYQLRQYMAPALPVLPVAGIKEKWEWQNGGLRPSNSLVYYTYTRGAIGRKSGVREWTVCIKSNNGVRVGISPMFTLSNSFDISVSYTLSCDNGQLWDAKTKRWVADYTGPIQTESNVSIHLDMDRHELTFRVDGKWLTKIEHIAQQRWFPFVGLSVGSTVTIVQ